MKFPSYLKKNIEARIKAFVNNAVGESENKNTHGEIPQENREPKEGVPSMASPFRGEKGKAWESGCPILLPLDSLRRGFYQPRRDFGDSALIALADSIRLHGLLHPLTVRPLPSEGEETATYAVIAGERRLRALEILGRKVAPCLILSVSAEEAAALSLIENLHREDLNLFEIADAEDRLASIAGEFLGETVSGNHMASRESDVQLLSLLLSQPETEVEKRRGLSFSRRERELILAAELPPSAVAELAKIRENTHRLTVLRELCRSYAREESANARMTALLSACETSAKIGGAKKQLILQDVRLFQNSIDRTVRSVREAGIDATVQKEELADRYRVVIELPKAPENRRDIGQEEEKREAVLSGTSA